MIKPGALLKLKDTLLLRYTFRPIRSTDLYYSIGTYEYCHIGPGSILLFVEKKPSIPKKYWRQWDYYFLNEEGRKVAIIGAGWELEESGYFEEIKTK